MAEQVGVRWNLSIRPITEPFWSHWGELLFSCVLWESLSLFQTHDGNNYLKSCMLGTKKCLQHLASWQPVPGWFLGHLNSQNPAIEFTMDKENDRKIAFLDVLVEKEGTSATTSIFRKKTHTDKYLNYNSHHHARIKSGIIKCLGTRARKVCHTTRLTGENNHLRQVFQANGYPTQLVYRILRNHPTPHHSPHPPKQTHKPRPPLSSSTYPTWKGSVRG